MPTDQSGHYHKNQFVAMRTHLMQSSKIKPPKERQVPNPFEQRRNDPVIIAQVLQMAREGYLPREIAETLKLTKQAVKDICHAHEISWTYGGDLKSNKERQAEAKRALLQEMRDAGMSNREIASELAISKDTVRNRLNNKPGPKVGIGIQLPQPVSPGEHVYDAKRCPTCGAKVRMPCLKCQLDGVT